MIKDLFSLSKEYEILADAFSLLKLSNTEKYGIFFNNEYWYPNVNFIKKEDKYSNLDFANNDLKNLLMDIKNYSIVGKIEQTSKYHYSNININKSFVNPYTLYINKIILLTTVFTFRNKTPYLSFQHYFKEFSQFIHQEGPSLTYSGHFKDKSVSVYSSGLSFAIIKENSNTLNMAKEYILDSNFNKFQELCSKNNFIIDRYMPWVIIRRLTPIDIQSNAYKYISVYQMDIDTLYTGLKEAYQYYIGNIIDNKYRELVNNTDYSLSKNDILEFYINLKLKEKNIELSTEEYKRLKYFFIYNSKKNTLRDSVSKIDRLQLKSIDTIFSNRSDSLYLR